MTLKEILEKLGSVSPEESGKIKELVAEAIRENNEREERITSLNKENAAKRKENNELRDQIADRDEKITGLSNSTDKAELDRLKAIETRYNAQQAEAETKLKSQWAEKAKIFSVDKTSKLFEKAEKVRGRFILPEEGKELTIDQINRNLEAFTLLEDTGYFTAETTHTPGQPPKTDGGNVTPSYDSGGAAIAASLGYK